MARKKVMKPVKQDDVRNQVSEAVHKDAAPDNEFHVRLSVVMYSLLAVFMGYASLFISPVIGNLYTVATALLASWIAGKLIQSALGKDFKWILGNGIIIYLFVWLVSWIFFFNLAGTVS